MHRNRLLRILLGLASLLVAMAFAGVASAAPPPDAAAGQQAWAQLACKSCHGANGEGKYALPLAGTTRTVDEVLAQVRNPRSMMPLFKTDKVTDTQIKDMYDYLKTLQKPASFTPVRYEAKADDPPGKVLFNQKRCVACHGENAERVAQIVLGTGRKTIAPDEVLKQLRTPRNNMPMFKDTIVSDAEAATIAAFLKTVVETAAAAPAAAPAPASLPTTGGAELPWASFAGIGGMLSMILGLALRRARR
ncbi:MAG: c-type cytochrome [Chloroflexi bacterium]|nr:c-type cytochrome [Chloroflexota bacterium]